MDRTHQDHTCVWGKQNNENQTKQSKQQQIQHRTNLKLMCIEQENKERRGRNTPKLFN